MTWQSRCIFLGGHPVYDYMFNEITKEKEEAEQQEQANEQSKKASEKLAEKGRAHCKLELEAVRLYI